MDGDPVTGEPSPFENRDNDGGEQLPADFPRTLTEVFYQVFPEYLAMGMSRKEFWEGPAWLARAYREAHEKRMRREEWARHRQGAYIFNALLCAAPVMRPFGKGKVEPGKYPEEPWPLTEKDAKALEERMRRQRFERMLAAFKKEGEENRRKREKDAQEGG